MPWDLSDLVAYLLLGVETGFAGLAAFYGVGCVISVVEQHAALTGVAAILFGYPTGLITYRLGGLLREVFRRLVPPASPKGDYASEVATCVDAVIGKLVQQGSAARLSPQSQVRVGVYLAGKYLPGAFAAFGRQTSMFRFFVTLVGAALLSSLAIGVGALLRWRGVIAGSAVPYAAWGLVPLGVLFLAENSARNMNRIVSEVMADTAAAVCALLAAERK